MGCCRVGSVWLGFGLVLCGLAGDLVGLDLAVVGVAF